MATFKELCAEKDLKDNMLAAFEVDGQALCAVKVHGQVKVYADRCPHQGVKLSEGKLKGCELTCAAHHWEFDLQSGQGLNPENAQLRAYPVKIENGVIFVNVDPQENVGPVLESGEFSDALLKALRLSYPSIRIQDAGAYVRVLIPQRCRVKRSVVAVIYGKDVHFPQDLEKVMVSFKGKFSVNEEEAEWNSTL